jgi:hypothetical protein
LHLLYTGVRSHVPNTGECDHGHEPMVVETYTHAPLEMLKPNRLFGLRMYLFARPTGQVEYSGIKLKLRILTDFPNRTCDRDTRAIHKSSSLLR